MQGFNMGRYVPPEHEGTTSANKLANKNALGSRARKAGQGILTVRFEMPFAIWCTTCPKETIIGQGVRFNAEKKKVGNYYSTPIYSFRMKHITCGGSIEIRTDPKNTAYVVTEGAKKRDTGDDKIHEGEIQFRTEEEKERLRNDAFAALEVTIDDKKQLKMDRTRIDDLLDAKDKDWSDPYAMSQKIRKKFRVGRKSREKNQLATDALKDRMSLGIDLLDETDGDRQRAAAIEFGSFGDGESDETLRKVQGRGLFTRGENMPQIASFKDAKKPKSGLNAAASKDTLQKELSHNTRAAIDPFLSEKPAYKAPAIPGIKRKRDLDTTINPSSSKETPERLNEVMALVSYGNDDDSD